MHDQKLLLQTLNNYDNLLPVYIFDKEILEDQQFGSKRISSFRGKFIIDTLKELKINLRNIGSDLHCEIGYPEEVIPSLASEIGAETILFSKEYAHDELIIEDIISNNKFLNVISMDNSTLFHPDDIPFNKENVPDIYSEFRKGVEKKSKVRELASDITLLPDLPARFRIGSIPNLIELGIDEIPISEKTYIKFKGGEEAALERLKYYLWDSKLIEKYKHTRNGLIGMDYSSKFSAWLAVGALSPRKIYHEIKKYESEVKENMSTYWLIFELIWRDYFRFITMKYRNKLFYKKGFKDHPKVYINSEIDFKKWKNGETGDKFVNANMKELNSTGFMSNRGRQNVASYLCKDLLIDWRWGAAYFEEKLIDYDVYSNWGNWAYVAGVGTDPRERKFNTKFQAEKYDPNGEYQNYWLGKQSKLF